MKATDSQGSKTALVTGSARRIGATIARALHQAGYQIIIHCRHSLTEAHGLADELNQKKPGSAIVIQKDLLDAKGPEELIQDSLRWKKRLDLLVNNASDFIKDPNSFDKKHWQHLMTINAEVPWRLSTAAAEALKKVSGQIINISDIHAKKPLKGYAVYCQSKAMLNMQTKALARELAPWVRVNAVAPGAIAWPEQDNALEDAEKQDIIEKTLLKKHGNPEFIAEAVLALAENAYITGQILAVDGGRSVR